ncbi:hypothetical protein BOFE_01040 [Candidatus Borrelia fainii]|uniref:Uncharacterized protein n=1 Tax=Candidatus Borrelia fainii TaxID=2518322 RepID=A0ABN6UQS6_9SPIR|nr:hypothetical protein [Candidatus Borrelia fainii]BDU62564.1 hypothetical protein BOFE_01040 [Candidatus Borrelia fainii]
MIKKIVSISNNYERVKEIELRKYEEQLQELLNNIEILKANLIKNENEQLKKELKELESKSLVIEKQMRLENIDMDIKFLNRLVKPLKVLMRIQSGIK